MFGAGCAERCGWHLPRHQLWHLKARVRGLEVEPLQCHGLGRDPASAQVLLQQEEGGFLAQVVRAGPEVRARGPRSGALEALKYAERRPHVLVGRAPRAPATDEVPPVGREPQGRAPRVQSAAVGVRCPERQSLRKEERAAIVVGQRQRAEYRVFEKPTASL